MSLVSSEQKKAAFRFFHEQRRAAKAEMRREKSWSRRESNRAPQASTLAVYPSASLCTLNVADFTTEISRCLPEMGKLHKFAVFHQSQTRMPRSSLVRLRCQSNYYSEMKLAVIRLITYFSQQKEIQPNSQQKSCAPKFFARTTPLL